MMNEKGPVKICHLADGTSTECTPAYREGASVPVPQPQRAERGRFSSQVAQEVQYMLLIGCTQHIEIRDHLVGFRAAAGVILDRGQQVIGAPVMQEEDALADPPQRCATELEAIGVALRNAVGQARSHIVYRVVAERVDRDIAYRRVRRDINQRQISGGLAHYVTARTADISECLKSCLYRRSRRCGGTAGRRR
jgi:hypothetical protein